MADRLFIPPDNQTTDLTVISVTDGATVLQLPFANCEAACQLANGKIAVQAENIASSPLRIGSIKVYDADFNLLVTNTSLVGVRHGFPSPIASHGTTIYVAQVDDFGINSTIIGSMSDTGVVGPSFTIEGDVPTQESGLLIESMGVSPDGLVLYYAPATFSGGIYRWDLVNNVRLATVVTVPGFPTGVNLGRDLLVLPDGSLLVPWHVFALDPAWTVRHYAVDGTLLNEYAIGNDTSIGFSPPRLALSSDQLSFWSMNFSPTQATSVFLNIRISDGVQLATFTIPNNFLGSNPTRPSQSCPLFAQGVVVACPDQPTITAAVEGGLVLPPAAAAAPAACDGTPPTIGSAT